jgi:hypothetical protein
MFRFHLGVPGGRPLPRGVVIKNGGTTMKVRLKANP